ncbi:MAG: carbohydrate ABC transporter permease [Thermomicrobiales bacterium]|jgi:multiple sugar transport system permease protein|nr:carbohydrate ABC transporter permease [Thermomicrobiales bacterium]
MSSIAAQPTTAAPRRRARRKIGAGTVLAWVFIVLLILFAVVPMAWMLSTSLKTQFAALRQPPQWIPSEPTLDQYKILFSPDNQIGGRFLRFFWNSFYVSMATTILGVVIAVPASYAFSRFKFPGRDALFFAVLARNMFPVVVFLIPLFILMKNLHLVNTELALILTYLTFGLPLSIWLLKGFFDNIPPELERAARIDGATRFGAFWQIVMPLSSPGIIATAIYTFIQAWNEYVYARTFLTQDKLLTLQPGLQKFFGEFSTNWPGLMAAQFASSVPVVVLFLVLQRYFVQALAEGATKA